jgi:hypothetical protein
LDKLHREEIMKISARSILLTAAVIAACGMLAGATASAQGVKIGVLNDQSGVYADFSGKGSVEGAKMAIEDFGGSVLGQKIEAGYRRSPKQARSRFRHRAPLVRRRRRRHDHRPQQFLGRARGAADRR